MPDAPPSTTGLTRASVAAGAVALASWAGVFSAVATEWVLVTAMIASVVAVALGVLARSESAAETGTAAPRPRWMTAIGILLIVLCSLAAAASVAIGAYMRQPHH